MSDGQCVGLDEGVWYWTSKEVRYVRKEQDVPRVGKPNHFIMLQVHTFINALLMYYWAVC